MVGWAIGVLVVSVIAAISGFSYITNHPLGGFGGDPTYSMAGWGALFGVIGFFIGIGLLIGGIASSSKRA